MRGVAATSGPDTNQQHKIIDGGKEVVEQAIVMVEEARTVINSHNRQPADAQRLAQVARDVSQALTKCAGCLPGQKDVDEAIQSIHQSSQVSYLAHYLTPSWTFLFYPKNLPFFKKIR